MNIKLTKPEKAIIKPRPESVIDSFGVVFNYKGGVYRAVSKNCVPLAKKILNNPTFFEAGLVETEISDLEAEGYGLVLKHKNIKFKSLPYEWTKGMKRDICLMILNLGRELHSKGFNFKDGQIFNSFFDFYTPKFVDIGSIIPLKTFPWEWSGVFINQMAHFLGSVGFLSLIDERDKYKNDMPGFYSKTIKNLNDLDLYYDRTEWTNYGGRPITSQNPKVKSLLTILEDLDRTTIIDIGANKGRFSMLASYLGYDVVAFDIDEISIQQLYEKAKEKKRNILPLVMNFLKPTKQIRGHEPATKRLKCDVSLFLAMVHHMCLRWDVSLEEIADGLINFTNKHIIIEWVHPNDPHVQSWHKHSWYSLDNFTGIMGSKGFRLVERLPSRPKTREIVHYATSK